MSKLVFILITIFVQIAMSAESLQGYVICDTDCYGRVPASIVALATPDTVCLTVAPTTNVTIGEIDYIAFDRTTALSELRLPVTLTDAVDGLGNNFLDEARLTYYNGGDKVCETETCPGFVVNRGSNFDLEFGDPVICLSCGPHELNKPAPVRVCVSRSGLLLKDFNRSVVKIRGRLVSGFCKDCFKEVAMLYPVTTPDPAPNCTWGVWSDYGGCTVSCGGGMESRTRSCMCDSNGVSTPAANSFCGTGASMETRQCNIQSCNGCLVDAVILSSTSSTTIMGTLSLYYPPASVIFSFDPVKPWSQISVLPTQTLPTVEPTSYPVVIPNSGANIFNVPLTSFPYNCAFSPNTYYAIRVDFTDGTFGFAYGYGNNVNLYPYNTNVGSVSFVQCALPLCA